MISLSYDIHRYVIYRNLTKHFIEIHHPSVTTVCVTVGVSMSSQNSIYDQIHAQKARGISNIYLSIYLAIYLSTYLSCCLILCESSYLYSVTLLTVHT